MLIVSLRAANTLQDNYHYTPEFKKQAMYNMILIILFLISSLNFKKMAKDGSETMVNKEKTTFHSNRKRVAAQNDTRIDGCPLLFGESSSENFMKKATSADDCLSLLSVPCYTPELLQRCLPAQRHLI